jgi:hypothetical protein
MPLLQRRGWAMMGISILTLRPSKARRNAIGLRVGSIVASLEDTLQGKIKDLADIARLVESHPTLWDLLGPDLKEIIQRP